MWIYDIIAFITTELFCIVVEYDFFASDACETIRHPEAPSARNNFMVWSCVQSRGGHPFPSSPAVKHDADLTFGRLTVTKLSKGSLNRSREAKMGL